MEVKLLNCTPLEIADIAICKCYGNEPHIDKEKVKARINRVANVSKHASTIEHIVYSFDIVGISRACLQELARHRIASYTVKSSRYTLQELKNEPSMWFERLADCPWELGYKYLVKVSKEIDSYNISQLSLIQLHLSKGEVNDLVKYLLPEAYKTSLVMTVNARTLQNFLTLRTSKHALWEIQLLAKAMYKVLPKDHKFLFNECING